MVRAWNTKYISHQSTAKWKVPGTQQGYQSSPMSNGKCLEQKTGITPTKCQMDRTLNTKQVPQQPNVVWKVPGIQDITAV
jgi:hypothetical protein